MVYVEGNPENIFGVVVTTSAIGSVNKSPAVVMETETQERLSARITGRVQGVGFRNFTRTRARRLGVTGWVRNERDGSVRLEAEGSREALDKLVEAVQRGPRMARVENVTVDWADATDDFDTFRVRR